MQECGDGFWTPYVLEGEKFVDDYSKKVITNINWDSGKILVRRYTLKTQNFCKVFIFGS